MKSTPNLALLLSLLFAASLRAGLSGNEIVQMASCARADTVVIAPVAEAVESDDLSVGKLVAGLTGTPRRGPSGITSLLPAEFLYLPPGSDSYANFRIAVACVKKTNGSLDPGGWHGTWLLLPAELVPAEGTPAVADIFSAAMFSNNLDWLRTHAAGVDPKIANFLLRQNSQSLLAAGTPREYVLALFEKLIPSGLPSSVNLEKYLIELGDTDRLVAAVRAHPTLRRPSGEETETAMSVWAGLSGPLNRELAPEEVTLLWNSGDPAIREGMLTSLSPKQTNFQQILQLALTSDDLETRYHGVSACGRIFGDSAVRTPAYAKFKSNPQPYLAKCQSILANLRKEMAY